MGRDGLPALTPVGYVISIHAPRMGRDFRFFGGVHAAKNFNPRAPYGARHRASRARLKLRRISIHAPRMGRDAFTYSRKTSFSGFQSTRPVWGATVGPVGKR